MSTSLDWILSRDDKFRYQLLDRMKMDCDYFLGNGQLYGNHLWAGNIKDQIDFMKAIWRSFPAGGKPEWLAWEQIEQFKAAMAPIENQNRGAADDDPQALLF